MVLRTVRVVAIVQGTELRVSRYEILRKQPAGAQRTAGDHLSGRLHRSDVGRIQKTRHSGEIAVRDQGAEGRVGTQRRGSGNGGADDPIAQIETFEHLIEHRRIAARASCLQCVAQTIISEIRFIEIQRGMQSHAPRAGVAHFQDHVRGERPRDAEGKRINGGRCVIRSIEAQSLRTIGDRNSKG